MAHRHAFDVVLRSEGKLAAQTLRVPTVGRLPVDQHVAAGGLIEPGNDLDGLCVCDLLGDEV